MADPLGQLESQGQNYSLQGDLGSQAAAGVGDLGASLASAVGWVADLGSKATDGAPGWAGLSDAMDSWRQASDEFAQNAATGVSPTTQALMSAPFTTAVTSNPMMYLAGNIARLAPTLVATIASTALTGNPEIAGGALFATGGTLTAGDVVNQIYSAVDNVPDQQLQDTNPLYKKYRDDGMSEAQARKAYRVDVAGVSPAVAFTIGGLANVVGGPGQLARALGKDVAGGALDLEGKNIIQRTVAGAAVGGGVGAAQGAATSLATQVPLANAGLQPFDSQALVNATLSGGAMGGAMGGVAEGAVAGLAHVVQDRASAPAKTSTAKPIIAKTAIKPVEVVEPAAPDAAQSEALAANHTAPGPVAQPAAEPTPAPEVPAQPTPASEVPAPEPAPVTEPSPQQAVQQPVTPEAPAVAPAPGVVAQTPTPHDTLFAVATKTKAASNAIAKIADHIGAPVDRVVDTLRQRTQGMDVAGIRAAIKEASANAARIGVEAGEQQGAKHRTIDETTARQDANTEAQRLTAQFPPDAVAENAALGGVNTPGVKEARAAVGKRTTAMAAAAEQRIAQPLAEQGQKFPERFKDNADLGSDWNGHMLLLSEARRLAKKVATHTAKSSDYQRFLTREADLRAGNTSAVKSERRAEGDMAFRKGVVDTTGDVVVAAPESAAGTDIEPVADRVTTKVPKSAKRPIAEGKTGPASAVRKVELSPEEKAALAEAATARAKAPKAPELVPEVVTESAGEGRASVEKVKVKAAAKKATAKASVKARIAAAAKKVDRNPTEAQIEAGTYQKGHVSVHGLDITIENPRGSTRSGVGPDGKPWSVKMPDHYGYIKRTEGADGDHVDVYIGPHPESDHVFLVEQKNAETGAFDEHKAMLGYDSVSQAMDAYDRSFSDGKASDRFGSVKPMSVDEFKTWLKEGDTTRPTDEYRATEHALADAREKIALAQTRGEPTPFVKARNAVAGFLNNLSDRDYLALEDRWATHEGNPEHLSVAQSLDDTAGPREAIQLGQQLKALHDGDESAAGPTHSPAVVSHMGNTVLDRLRQVGGAKRRAAEETRQAKERAAVVEANGRQYDLRKVLDAVGGKLARFGETAEDTIKTGEVTDQAQKDRVSALMAPTVISRIRALAGHVPVHVLPDDVYRALTGPDSRGYYDAVNHHIVFPESTFNNSARGAAHAVIHEAAHAAFKTATETNTKVQRVVAAIMREAMDNGIEFHGGGYALSNIDEFIAESMSNPEVQRFLGTIKAPEHIRTALNMGEKRGSLWDAIVETFRQALGLPRAMLSNADGSLLHAMLRVGDELDRQVSANPEGRATGYSEAGLTNALLRRADLQRASLQRASLQRTHIHTGPEAVSHLTTDAITKTFSDMKDAVESVVTGNDRVRQMPAPKVLAVHTMDQIAAKAGRYFQGNPVRKVFNALEAVRISATKTMQGFEPEIMALHKMADKYRGDVFDNFAQLMHDSTMAGVYPNHELLDAENSHISKAGYTDAWQRAMHGELKAKFDALPSDLKATFAETATFFKNNQNKLALAAMQNRLMVALGVEDKDLVARIFNGAATAADKTLLGSKYDVVKQAGELSKLDGPYFPLMRRGEYAVTGEHPVAAPKSPDYIGRTQTGAYEFRDKEAASKFATLDEHGAVRALRPTVHSVWVDSRTGSEFGNEPDGEQVKITPQDTYAEQRWRVSLQNKHVEFVATKGEAEKLHYELEQAGLTNVQSGHKLLQPGSPRGDMLSVEAKAALQIIQRGDAYQKMTDAQKHEVEDVLTELSLRYLGSTRIQSRALPRRYVAGASKDVVRNTYEYAQATANYLGKLEHAPELDKAIEEMSTQAKGDYGKDTTMGRTAIYNEVMKRVTNFTPIAGDTKGFSPVTKRLMALSFLDKLMSPAHSVVNAMQPGMLSFPVIGGRHGLGRTLSAMTKAYNDIGAIDIAKAGVQKTVEHAVKPTTADLATFIEDTIARVKNPGERTMLRFLVDHGSIDPDAGFEVNRMISASNGVGGKFDQGLNYLDGIARQMPRAVETINRTATALAAYRLELAKNGGDHQGAVDYAQEVTNMTHGVYSNTNAAPIFNHPLLRMSLQFKKYGQMVYALLGHQIGKAILNVNPGDRAEAVKTLGTLAAMHIAIAGTLGLPTEPFKWLLLGAHFAGLTDYKWADVENWERDVLAHVAGAGAGEVLARGVTRMLPGGLAFDLSGRVGLQDLMTFSEPTSTKPDDLWSYFGQLVAGAPGSLAMDYVKGAQAVSAGDFEQAAELMVPLKSAADAITAYRKLTEGKVSKSGNQTMAPYSLPEALVRVFGFTPGREAENTDAQSAYYNQTQRVTSERNGFQQSWYQASPSERMRLWGQIEQWNKTATPQTRITRAQLETYTKRRQSDLRSGRVTNGLLVTPRTRNVLDQTSSTYNN